MSEKVNQANLLKHDEKEEAPCKNGYSFRFQGIIDKSVEQLKVLNKHIYPDSDKEAIYTEVLKRGPTFNYYGVYNDIAVGAVVTRQEDQKLYIAILHVLPRYRRLGVGSRLLDKALEIAKNKNLKTVYLHAPAGDEALAAFLANKEFTQEEGSAPPQDKNLYYLK